MDITYLTRFDVKEIKVIYQPGQTPVTVIRLVSTDGDILRMSCHAPDGAEPIEVQIVKEEN